MTIVGTFDAPIFFFCLQIALIAQVKFIVRNPSFQQIYVN